MTATPRKLVSFRGPVQCSREEGPLALTLSGKTSESRSEPATLAFAFAGTAPPDLPEALSDVTVEQLPESGFRIVSGAAEWTFRASGCHLHRQVSEAFYRTIEPRPARWSRKIFWHLVLALVSSPSGKRLLLALRRR